MIRITEFWFGCTFPINCIIAFSKKKEKKTPNIFTILVKSKLIKCYQSKQYNLYIPAAPDNYQVNIVLIIKNMNLVKLFYYFYKHTS